MVPGLMPLSFGLDRRIRAFGLFPQAENEPSRQIIDISADSRSPRESYVYALRVT